MAETKKLTEEKVMDWVFRALVIIITLSATVAVPHLISVERRLSRLEGITESKFIEFGKRLDRIERKVDLLLEKR